MNASSESGLCATVMVGEPMNPDDRSEDGRRKRSDGVRAAPNSSQVCRLPPIGPHGRLTSVRIAGECAQPVSANSLESGRDLYQNEIAGWVAAHPAMEERMTHQSFGSDRLREIRPCLGAAKLAPHSSTVNLLSGGR